MELSNRFVVGDLLGEGNFPLTAVSFSPKISHFRQKEHVFLPLSVDHNTVTCAKSLFQLWGTFCCPVKLKPLWNPYVLGDRTREQMECLNKLKGHSQVILNSKYTSNATVVWGFFSIFCSFLLILTALKFCSPLYFQEWMKLLHLEWNLSHYVHDVLQWKAKPLELQDV